MLNKLVALPLMFILLTACTFGEQNASQPGSVPETTTGDMATLAQIKAKGVLTIGTAITKPFEFHDPKTNELIGFDVDTANLIAQKLGVKVEWKEMQFAALIPSLETGKVDMTIAAMYITDARKQVVDFAEPYADTGLVMVIRPDLEGNVKTSNDLNGLKVGVKIGATGDKLAQDLIAQGVKLERKEYKETMESFMDLEAGRVDVVLNDYLNTLAYLKDTGSKAKIVADEKGQVNFLSHVGLGIAVQKGNVELIEAINAILKEMKANGTFEQIYSKWLKASQN